MVKNKLALFGCVVLLIMILSAVFAPILARYDPDDLVDDPLLAPSASHLFGTDELGRDMFSRAVFGARISLSIGVVAVVISLTIGILIGSVAGYFGGFVDSLIMRFVDAMLAFPTIFLILSIQAILNPNIYNVMIVIGATSWMGVSRLVRGEFLSIKQRSYIEAARSIGCSNSRIIFRHILPNAMAPVIVAATLGIAGAILTESALSFLGMGVQPPMSSWGNMLMDASAYMQDAWWIAVFPGLLIFISVLSIYFVGEGIREALNPKG